MIAVDSRIRPAFSPSSVPEIVSGLSAFVATESAWADARMNQGNFLRSARHRLALTLDEAAPVFGFSKPYLSMVETGRVPITSEMAVKAISLIQDLPGGKGVPEITRNAADAAALVADVAALRDENRRLRGEMRKAYDLIGNLLPRDARAVLRDALNGKE